MNKKELPTEIDDQTLNAMVQQRRQALVESITRELGTWLDEHHCTLQVVSSFSADGRLITQIQVELK